jgi:Na+-transporting methylmalonyl-CoA/oxaloacetate decarboxylase gamma subunit
MDTTVITEVATTVAEMQYEFAVTPENLSQTVPIMGKGMVGIFIVMGIIILCVTLLNHFGSPDRKAKKEAKKAAKAQANANQQNQ